MLLFSLQIQLREQQIPSDFLPFIGETRNFVLKYAQKRGFTTIVTNQDDVAVLSIK